MGMFDDLICEVPLPDGYVGSFQTKDLTNTLTTHRITENGRLEEGVYEWRDDDDAPLGVWRKRIGWKDTNFHGVLNFYTWDEASDPKWREYDAKFTDGHLVGITAVEAVS